MNEAWIIDAVRTPIGRVHGQLAELEVQQLLAPLILALLGRNAVQATTVDEVVIGNAAGPGGNPARLALLQAGLPVEVPGVTVDRQCGSGLEAINHGVRLVQCGAAKVVLAGGVESPSTAPRRARAAGPDSHGRHNSPNPEFYHRARFSPEDMGDPDMGVAAENVAQKHRIDRARQDRFALRSHQNALAAQQAGVFDREIVSIKSRCGQITTDECPRADTSMEQLSALSPAFAEHGTVTAGNACPINDGAALVLIVAAEVVADLKLAAARSEQRPCARALRFVDAKAAGVDPNLLGLGPVPAVQALLQSHGSTVDDLHQIEFNEAFAAQVLACVDLLGLDEQRLNPAGGALALGHPYGASGAILVTRLLHSLQPGQFGLATLGIGGGQGLASLFEAV